ncbi:TIM barrel protein [Actinotalea sp. M2MS4P-6]|uniref:sugar phosphate isomerase/epimerase family protein n=1 Tax=Actinotalea sp. M2MS4P-6 TaxID=2983762 RepID=UPI0021E3CB0D|nr:TIM barrel protein [Actinotalea sp. M2MS4P-6]MCV2394381.1 TIM barrel protein [Actinotalea sp. M2MS4P-6]
MTDTNVDVAGTGISLGVTLYSFTNEWWSRQYDLTGLVAEVAGRGLGPGVEIVGFQSLRTFPEVDADSVSLWRGLVDRFGIVPTCLGSNVDVALRADRSLDRDEMVDYLNRQLDTAAALGFPVVRIQIGADPAVIERCLARAEKHGIRMGMEIHAPESAVSPAIMRVREFYESVDSPLLGFIPDFSSTMRRVPEGVLADLRARGLSEGAADGLTQAWLSPGNQFANFGAWAEASRAAGEPDDAVGAATLVFTMHGRAAAETWAELAPRIVHVHGKCYEFDEVGDEPSIDYPSIATVLVDSRYQGWISTEWEGHVFAPPGTVDAFDVVASQQALLRRSLTAAAG